MQSQRMNLLSFERTFQIGFQCTYCTARVCFNSSCRQRDWLVTKLPFSERKTENWHTNDALHFGVGILAHMNMRLVQVHVACRSDRLTRGMGDMFHTIRSVLVTAIKSLKTGINNNKKKRNDRTIYIFKERLCVNEAVKVMKIVTRLFSSFFIWHDSQPARSSQTHWLIAH